MVAGNVHLMRVVHVMTRTNIGGPSVMLVDLLTGLDPLEFNQVVVRGTPHDDEGDFFAGRELQAEVITLGALRRRVGGLSELRSLFDLVRVLRRLQPDIVHTHMAKAGVLGRLAAIVARVPIRVHTYHGHLLHGYFSPIVTWLVTLTERMLGRFTDWHLVVGSQTRDDLCAARVVDESRSTVIVPAAPLIEPLAKHEACRQLGLPNDRPLVGFVGRLTGIKRPDRFLALATTRTDAHFVVVGDGPLRDAVANQTRTQPNVTLVGWQQDLSVVYGTLDVVVLTSDNEGIPLSLLEAASAGVAILSLDVGGVGEIISDRTTGALVADDSQLASRLAELLDQPTLRRDLAHAAQRDVRSRFTVERYLAAHAEVYRRLVRGR
jgi:glycosyltransferase involved in cell wall biosynthesis